MTLIVAGISGDSLWMVADTFITGGSLKHREYEHQIKIVASTDRCGLVGFAGDQFHGSAAIERVREMPVGCECLKYLREVSRSYPVQFAYGMILDGTPSLFRISDGASEKLLVLNIGTADAFDQFQEIRHRIEVEPIPLSIAAFMYGSRAESIPHNMKNAVLAMTLLFLERPERDVGGAAIPYLLAPTGVFFLDYSYTVTDPITNRLERGDPIPHGTQEMGGFGISVTELVQGDGVVLYWLQIPGGLIFRRQAQGYEILRISGTPSAFLAEAAIALGWPVSIWFGEGPPHDRIPDSVSIVRNRLGNPAVAFARFGREIQMTALDTSIDFDIGNVKMELVAPEPHSPVLETKLSDDGESVHVAINGPDGRIVCSAENIEAMIEQLGSIRARMKQPVRLEATLSGKQEFVVLDPAWRTEHSSIPNFEGLLLRLRHIGLGWVNFMLPHNEARALASWLMQNARPETDGSR